MTPQGRAMQAAALRFGNGATLPFTHCKKGYKPFAGDEKMYACPLHHKERKRRVEKEGFRKGEVDLNVFWQRRSQSTEGMNGREASQAIRKGKHSTTSVSPHISKKQRQS